MHQPVLTFPPEVLLKAQGTTPEGIRAVIFDVDGVLTDGSLFYTEAGESIKAFSVLDGFGMLLLKQAGIQIIVITGRDSAPLRKRLADFGIDRAFFSIKNKRACAEQILAELKICWGQVAVMGDDWPDIALFNQAAFSVAPSNAHVETKAQADYVTLGQGGKGAAREFCELLLMASGRYAQLLQTYVEMK